MITATAIAPYLQLTRLNNPVGTLLLLWPTLAALWIASDGVPRWYLIIIFSIGTLLTRSAGCAINDYADRNLDGSVRRTANRPLATGALRPRDAVLTAMLLTVVAAILLVFLNRPTQLLAVGAVIVATIYPFTKRWTFFPQAVLGAAFSWGILMAWTATQGALTRDAGVMFVSSVLWIVAYDTLYAMVDREDDIHAGIKSTRASIRQSRPYYGGRATRDGPFRLLSARARSGFQLRLQSWLVRYAGMFHLSTSAH